MLKQFNEGFFSELVKKRGELVTEPAKRDEILKAAKRIRSCDYLFNFDIKNGVANSKSMTTRANWIFLLTNAACYWESSSSVYPLPVMDFPRVGVNFENFSPRTPFNSSVENYGTVKSGLVFGRENSEYLDAFKNSHFEEYKNLYYLLDQRFTISLDIKSTPSYNIRGSVILSGLELDLNEV